jgi:exosortase A-associated hydrolase 2
MSVRSARLPAESFFLDAEPGRRFCVFHPPSPEKVPRGALIYVHPFAEELNCSRHIVTLQARKFADIGVGVLLIDLFGCGDSSGEFGEALWQIWKADLAIAKKWLEKRLAVQVGLWGLRLGASLALDFARGTAGTLEPLILWQPVIRGRSFLTQFLRLDVANDMLSAQKTDGTQALRTKLLDGENLEIAGYTLSPDLAAEIDAIDISAFGDRRSSVHWLDIVRTADGAMSPATAEIIGEWRRRGGKVQFHASRGLPFWMMHDSPDCTEILDATTAIFNDFPAAS